MPDEAGTNWSPEEQQALRHEAFVAAVLRERRSQEKTEGRDRPKPMWLQLLESAGGVALITIVFGSVGAALLNSMVQEKLKERELAAAGFQEEQKQKQQIITQAYELIGNCIATAEDLIYLSVSEFAPDRFVGDQRQKIVVQRNGVRDKYDTVDAQWRTDRLKLALLIGLQSNGQEQLTAAWRGVQDAVTAFKDCAEDFDYAHEQQQVYVSVAEGRDACKDQKQIITLKLDQFSQQAQRDWRGSSEVSGK
jgi:hypothetical protein